MSIREQKDLLDGWIITDPDNFQFRKDIDQDKWKFKEFDRFTYQKEYNLLKKEERDIEKYWYNSEMWIEEFIDLTNYTKSQANYHCSAYYSKTDFNKFWNKNREIIAECIFEQESQLY